MQRLITVLVLSLMVSRPALAHPGHGVVTSDSQSWLHYLAEGPHAVAPIAIGLLLAWIAMILRRRRASLASFQSSRR